VILTYKVSRRFSDFEAFYNHLQNTLYTEYLLPPLPDKQFFLKNYLLTDESAYVQQRMLDLEYFLVRLNSHHRIRFCKEYREFLTGEKLE
jgi:hypothetical protein